MLPSATIGYHRLDTFTNLIKIAHSGTHGTLMWQWLSVIEVHKCMLSIYVLLLLTTISVAVFFPLTTTSKLLCYALFND